MKRFSVPLAALIGLLTGSCEQKSAPSAAPDPDQQQMQTISASEIDPEDEATGFQVGELRGIFSAKVPLR